MMKPSYILIYLISLLSLSFARLNAAEVEVQVTPIERASFYCFLLQKGVARYDVLLESGKANLKDVEAGDYEVVLALSTKLGYSVIKASHVKVRMREKIEFAIEPGFVRVKLEAKDIVALSDKTLKSVLPVLRFQKNDQPKGGRELYEQDLMPPTDKGFHLNSFITLSPGAYSVFLGTLAGVNMDKWIAAKEVVITEENLKTQSLDLQFTAEHVLKVPLQRNDFKHLVEK